MLKHKNALCLALGVISGTALAGGNMMPMAAPHHQAGWFMTGGIGAGWSSADSKNFVSTRTVSAGGLPLTVTTNGESNLIEGSGFSFNLATGYQWKYFALSMGYLYTPDYTELETGHLTVAGVPFGSLNSKDKASLNTLSFMGKLIYPLGHACNIFFGTGLAIVWKHAFNRHSTVYSAAGRTVTTQPGAHATFYRPEIAVGATHQISQHWASSVVYTRIFGEKNISVNNAEQNFLPDMNSMRVEATYYFNS